MFKVSVIIPSYNAEKYIEQTILSALNQTWKNIEIIVVDDGSDDKSYFIAKAFSSERVKVYKNPGKGACAARNFGYMQSKGDLIQFLDADDLLSPHKIESQIRVWNNNEGVLLNGRWGRFYTNDPMKENILWGPDKSLQNDLQPLDWILANNMSQTACWLTPRKLIEKAGLWNESLLLNQDGEFFTRIVANSSFVKFCNDAKVFYRSGLNSSITSNQVIKTKVESKLKSLLLIEETIFTLEVSERTKLLSSNNYLNLLYLIYPRYPDIVEDLFRKIDELGGGNLPFNSTPLTEKVARVIGWKMAKRIRYLLGRV